MSKKAFLKRRGQESIREILAQSGGIYTTDEVAELLSLSVGEVSSLVEQKGLLAIELDGENRFPTWQFDGNGVVPRFGEIMGVLDTSSPFGTIRFFLTYYEDLGQTAIAALKGKAAKNVDAVKFLARQFNYHIAR